MAVSTTSRYVLYHYDPSLPAAAIFAILFLLLTCYHTWKAFRTGSRFFIALIIGCFFEFLGYSFRMQSHGNRERLMPYIVQSTMLLVAPALLAATIYMSLSRLLLVTKFDKILDPFPTKWITKFFVLGDIMSFIGQLSGGGLLAMAASQKPELNKPGKTLILVGLGLQLGFVAGFIAMVGACQLVIRRMARLSWKSIEIASSDDRGSGRKPRQNGENEGTSYDFGIASNAARDVLLTLMIASLLIFVRNVFRVVEYIQGMDGYLMGHEAYLYIFDSTLMFIVGTIFVWRYPSDVWKPALSREIRGHDEV